MEKDKCCKQCDGMKMVKLTTNVNLGPKCMLGVKECSVYEYSRLHKNDLSMELIECWCGDCGIMYHVGSI